MELSTFPAEWSRSVDRTTGAPVLQWTAAECIHHHPYFTNHSISSVRNLGFFISYRTGYPNIHTIDLATGTLSMLTNRVDINPFSAAPCVDGSRVYFSAGNRVFVVETETGDPSVVASFSCQQLGICSLNREENKLIISLRHKQSCELVMIDLNTGETCSLLRKSEIGHVQFCPIDDTLILFSGPIDSRLWLFDRKSGKEKLLYRQRPEEWITHESWLGGGRSIIFSRWPHALCALDTVSGDIREIAAINAWHSRSTADGSNIVCDTNHPDRGLLLVDSMTGAHQVICHPQATSRGSQWRHSIPAVGAGIDTSILRSTEPEKDAAPHFSEPESTYGPQWSHPHPSFSPDGKNVVFTSDRTEWSQVYSVEINME